MERDALIDIAYGEADRAEFATGPWAPRPAPTSAEESPVDRALVAGLYAFATLLTALWVAVLLLAAGWLADLFLAALPWSLGLLLPAVALVAILLIGRSLAERYPDL